MPTFVARLTGLARQTYEVFVVVRENPNPDASPAEREQQQERERELEREQAAAEDEAAFEHFFDSAAYEQAQKQEQEQQQQPANSASEQPDRPASEQPTSPSPRTNLSASAASAQHTHTLRDTLNSNREREETAPPNRHTFNHNIDNYDTLLSPRRHPTKPAALYHDVISTSRPFVGHKRPFLDSRPRPPTTAYEDVLSTPRPFVGHKSPFFTKYRINTSSNSSDAPLPAPDSPTKINCISTNRRYLGRETALRNPDFFGQELFTYHSRITTNPLKRKAKRSPDFDLESARTKRRILDRDLSAQSAGNSTNTAQDDPLDTTRASFHLQSASRKDKAEDFFDQALFLYRPSPGTNPRKRKSSDCVLPEETARTKRRCHTAKTFSTASDGSSSAKCCPPVPPGSFWVPPHLRPYRQAWRGLADTLPWLPEGAPLDKADEETINKLVDKYCPRNTTTGTMDLSWSSDEDIDEHERLSLLKKFKKQKRNGIEAEARLELEKKAAAQTKRLKQIQEAERIKKLKNDTLFKILRMHQETELAEKIDADMKRQTELDIVKAERDDLKRKNELISQEKDALIAQRDLAMSAMGDLSLDDPFHNLFNNDDHLFGPAGEGDPDNIFQDASEGDEGQSQANDNEGSKGAGDLEYEDPLKQAERDAEEKSAFVSIKDRLEGVGLDEEEGDEEGDEEEDDEEADEADIAVEPGREYAHAMLKKFTTPLNQEWTDKVNATMRISQAGTVVATSIGNVELSRADIGTVLDSNITFNDDPTEWLNDEIVNAFYANLVAALNKRAGYVKGPNNAAPYAAYNTAWYNNAYKKGVDSISRWSRRHGISGKKLLETEAVFLPVNQGAHWILISVSGKSKKILHLDSLDTARGGGYRKSTEYMALTRDWLAMELGDAYVESEWSEVDRGSAIQSNGNDCGMFTCMNGLAFALGFEDVGKWFGPRDMRMARRAMIAMLVNGGFVNDFGFL